VGLLTWLLNKRRLQKINIVDQFIMGYGGIRGAVCYGLVMSLKPMNADDPTMVSSDTIREMFVSTTLIVIAFTVFFQAPFFFLILFQE
jgi:sodium/hydrogen exchanger-like protein 3